MPGYPFWVERTDGARFDSPVQKAMFAHHLNQGVQIEAGHLDPVRRVAAEHRTAVYLGCVERRPIARGTACTARSCTSTRPARSGRSSGS